VGSTPAIGEAQDRLARTLALSEDVTRLRYAKRFLEPLERLGLARVRDVLLHVPHRYLDFTNLVPVSHADVGREATVVVTVDEVRSKRPRPRLSVVELACTDGTGVIMASFFKQPWIAEQIHRGDVVALSGKVTFRMGFKQMSSPFHEVLGDASDQGVYARILPVHPVGEGISAAWMRRIVSAALADVGDVCDFLPADLVAGHRLMTLSRALRAIHFPDSSEEAGQARRRLAYDELLCLQLALLCRRHVETSGVEPFEHVVDGPRMRALDAALPFELTDEQALAAHEILADMAAPQVMGRLLLGDVGTGKTAVAAVALAAVADSGTQAAVMAPTSVLAGQYASKLGPLLDRAAISWALVTGATPAAERSRIREAVAAGRTTVVFGTTALLSDDIEFRRLTFVCVDEQHRFGVDQRAALRRKGAGADLLTMTATPIPRTLALSVYGDVACSRLTRRPNPGAGIATQVITPENVDLAYGAIREAVEAGQQAYVVCPLVDDQDEGEELDDVPAPEQGRAARPHAATAMAGSLARGALKGLRTGLLTGRMSVAEKDDVMSRFRAGSIDVLVSTTVIEVGVDVPAATVMLVWDADRFGLATLHQLRGRVGRGDVSGVVYLESGTRKGTPARARLSALEETSDGFELAELDLKLRHEGELLGYRQSGGVSLRLVDLEADFDLIDWAHADARAISREDPGLALPAHAPISYEVRDRFGVYFEEVRGQ
jgi:ATP-dependent DNA helicase RecG